MYQFIIASDIESLRSTDTRLVEFPTDLQMDKKALFSWYAEVLNFPDYFGYNWDAFIDCIRDLSWIPEQRIVIFHRNIPLSTNLKDQKIYIDILTESAQQWKTYESQELIVAFDPVCELPLRAITKRASG